MSGLTDGQRRVLSMLDQAGEPRSAYPGLNLRTLSSLEARGLVHASRGLGSMAFPRNAIAWSLTETGLAALQTPGATDDQ